MVVDLAVGLGGGVFILAAIFIAIFMFRQVKRKRYDNSYAGKLERFVRSGKWEDLDDMLRSVDKEG